MSKKTPKDKKRVPFESEKEKPQLPKGYVAVPEDFLTEVRNELNKVKKDNEMLLMIADKKALATYYQRNQKELPKEVRIREIGGKVILGWRTTEDRVEKIDDKRWIEVQRVELLFEDGTSKEMSLGEFNLKYKHINCRRTGIITDEATGSEAFKLVRYDNGQEITIGVQFVN